MLLLPLLPLPLPILGSTLLPALVSINISPPGIVLAGEQSEVVLTSITYSLSCIKTAGRTACSQLLSISTSLKNLSRPGPRMGLAINHFFLNHKLMTRLDL